MRVGTSGWRYARWRGSFYPQGLVQRRELEYAAQTFDSVEINGSFYSLQRPASWVRWAAEVPQDFVFAVKGPRFVTHMLRMRNAEAALGNFFGSGLLALGEKLGPVLWQLPARQGFDAAQLDDFLARLPKTTAEADRLIDRHDAKLTHQPVFSGGGQRTIRHALEVRHESFRTDEALSTLQRHGVALVESDGGASWPRIRETTADFVYVRLHGAERLYASGYEPAELEELAAHLRGQRDGGVDGVPRDGYVYFDNDAEVRAPFDAMALAELLR